MRVKDCKTMDDVIKYIIRKGGKQDYHTLEIEQIQNMLIVTYGKLVEDTTKAKMKDLNLIYTTKIKKDNELPMKFQRVKLNLCNFIEPRKSRKKEFQNMWNEATNIEEVEN